VVFAFVLVAGTCRAEARGVAFQNGPKGNTLDVVVGVKRGSTGLKK